MKKNTLLILVAFIAVLIIGSIFISSSSDSNRSEDESKGQFLVPGLYDRINDVTSIEIISSSGNLVIRKSDKDWIVISKDNYPANVTQIRNSLVALAELEKVEAKTKKEKNYIKLGVQDPSNDAVTLGSQSRVINLKAKKKNIASIIIGNKKSGHTAAARGIKQLNYARLIDDKQVWLIAGNLKPSTSNDFMNTEITNIAADRIQQINISHVKGSTVTISKNSKTDKEFTLKQLPKKKELASPGILTAVAASLANLKFDDVAAQNNAESFTKIKNPVKVEFKTFNGLTIKMKIAKLEDKYYLWLDSTSSAPATVSLKQSDVENKSTAPDAELESTQLNKKHQNWLYTIPSYKAESLTKQLSDLIKSKETEKK